VPCPLDFDWEPYAEKCYSAIVLGPMLWSEAADYCNDLNSNAKLAEPHNAVVNQWLGILAGKYIL